MIWETVFNRELTRAGSARDIGDPSVTSIVHLDGAWHGAVMLQCPLTLAEDLAAAMFDNAASTTFDEVIDALGEITNMVAGNLKPLLPQPCAISLPAVARGSDYEIEVVGATVIARVAFTCAGSPMVVTLLQGTRQRGETA